MDRVIRITCEKEIGRWTVRMNEIFIVDFWREAPARRMAMNLIEAIIRTREATHE